MDSHSDRFDGFFIIITSIINYHQYITLLLITEQGY